MSKKRKRRKVPKDKDSGLPKKYLSGLSGSKRSSRASLIKMDYLTQNGQVVKCKTRRKNGTYKKTKEASNGFTKSYTEETKAN